jgi:hypothetical protein
VAELERNSRAGQNKAEHKEYVFDGKDYITKNTVIWQYSHELWICKC